MNYQEFRKLFKKDAPKFELKKFKKEFSEQYARILEKQEGQLSNLKDTVNYKKMLAYSIELECERWYVSQKQ